MSKIIILVCLHSNPVECARFDMALTIPVRECNQVGIFPMVEWMKRNPRWELRKWWCATTEEQVL